MIQKVTFAFACLLLLGCSEENKTNIPDTILPEVKMAEVMRDVHLLEASMSLNTYPASQAMNKNPIPAFDVFAKHQITKKQYDESFDYYSQHPDLLNNVYQLTLENLSKMQAEVNSKKEEVKIAADTTKPTHQKTDRKLKIKKRNHY